jgi:UDP-N-acetylenolpyruvoylglucosamine reductase
VKFIGNLYVRSFTDFKKSFIIIYFKKLEFSYRNSLVISEPYVVGSIKAEVDYNSFNSVLFCDTVKDLGSSTIYEFFLKNDL